MNDVAYLDAEAGTSPSPDNLAAIRFLELIQPGGPWLVSAISNGKEPITTRALSAVEDLREFVAEHNGTRNLYYAPNRPAKMIDKKASEAEIELVEFLHTDVDPRAGEDLEAEFERIRALAPKGVPEPSFVVFSGGGCQFVWRLREPTRDKQAAEARNKWLANQYGGDHCCNIAWVLRLPGTINLPNGQKQKKGRVPALARLIDHRSAAYNLDDFGAVETETGDTGDYAAVGVADLDELDLPERVKTAIVKGKDIDNPLKGENTRSEWVWLVVCEMVRHHVPEGKILGAITNPRWKISDHVLEQSNPDTYARRQIRRAVAIAQTLVLSKDSPAKSAEEFLFRQRPTLMHYNDDFLAWNGSAYDELEDATIRSELYKFLKGAETPGKKKGPLVPFDPTSKKVSDVADALRAECHVRRDLYDPPCWLSGDGPPPRELLACRNGLLHLPTGRLLEPMERFFTRNALDFDFDPDAPAPVEWLKFLRSLRKDDAEVALLQEIFGYLIVPDTSQQKIFMLYGPRRSGKGTIAKILGQLVGRHNTAGPSFKSLDRDFGLAALVGKQLALVSDMRVGRQTDKAALTENLLRISGEDVVTIDRKYKSSWTGHLAVRFLILTNKLPSIPDDSGALASRFVPLAMTESFLGREDVGLFDKLKPELPGVLLWSIEGWRRLRERGHFDLPTASRDLADRIHTGGSPITAFLNERFTFDAKASTPKNKIWQAWGSWCQSHGVFAGDTSQFGQGLIEAGQGRISAHKPVIEGGQVPSYRGLKFADEPPAQEKIPF